MPEQIVHIHNNECYKLQIVILLNKHYEHLFNETCIMNMYVVFFSDVYGQ